MSLAKHLDQLASAGAYAGGNKSKIRWGQLIRENATLTSEEVTLTSAGNLVSLNTLGQIKGGIVTRANAYFLVREIPFDQIPARMKVTRADLKRIAVVADGLDFISKIEREFLKPVIKGPESLESTFGIKRGDLRLFAVKESPQALQKRHANGALSYIRRGETVNFKTSDDDLKGGIPSQRSQVKNRKPYWYCLQGVQKPGPRIVFPEHIGQRYVFTLVERTDKSVVIDKLYLFEPDNVDATALIHASLNTLFTWYQVELRGRSQLGEGVLELKIPDYAGLLVLNPMKLSKKQGDSLLEAFAKLPISGAKPSLQELGTPTRLAFDHCYLSLCGFRDPETTLLRLERELRALAGERIERKLSVADAKVSRRKITNVAATIDAYATRVAASVDPHPDPRTFIPEGARTEIVLITAPVEGQLVVGTELFSQGEVLAGDVCVARAGTVLAAQFVRGVLLVQPDLTQIEVPTKTALEEAISEWNRESRKWHKQFAIAAERALVGLEDPRTRTAIEQQALKLLHAT
jgi:hypothetical protein